MTARPIKISKMLKKVKGTWTDIPSSAINNSDDIDGLVLVTTDDRKFKITEILKDGEN